MLKFSLFLLLFVVNFHKIALESQVTDNFCNEWNSPLQQCIRYDHCVEENTRIAQSSSFSTKTAYPITISTSSNEQFNIPS